MSRYELTLFRRRNDSRTTFLAFEALYLAMRETKNHPEREWEIRDHADGDRVLYAARAPKRHSARPSTKRGPTGRRPWSRRSRLRSRHRAPSIVTVTLSVSTGLQCRWCGRPYESTSGPGRPRLYCRRSCRQRDYESRQRSSELGLGEHELIVTRQELNELRDRLYMLGKTVKDVENDLTDDDADDERRLLNVLLYAAKQATT